MIGVDTNLLVRILTNDDPIQARRAAKVLQSDDIYITKTVKSSPLLIVHLQKKRGSSVQSK